MVDRDAEYLFGVIVRECVSFDAPVSEARDVLSQYQNIKIWRQVLQLFEIHRISALVFWNLRTKGLEPSVPAEIYTRLRVEYLRSAERMRIHFEGFKNLCTKLNQIGIVPAVWKGIHIAESYYPDSAMRSLLDIDLVIFENEFAKVSNLLSELGFREQFLESASGDAYSYLNTGGLVVDLHTSAKFFDSLPHDQVYCEKESFDGIPLRYKVLRPSAFIAHQFEHMRGHLNEDGFRLRFVFDLLYFLEKEAAHVDRELVFYLLQKRNRILLLRKTFGLLDELRAKQVCSQILQHDPAIRWYTIDEINRNALMAKWGLPHYYCGWFRYLRSFWSSNLESYKTCPNLKCILTHYFDRKREAFELAKLD